MQIICFASKPFGSFTSEQVSLVPIFLCKKISHLLYCSSFFVKRLARLTCSFVNALTTVRCHYHLFTSVPSARKWHLNHSVPPPKKTILRNSLFFSYICLWRVLLLRSYIRLRRVILCFAQLMANIT